MHTFRRTRIIATIGPSSGSVSMLSRMIMAGLSIARLNFSHGTHESHKDYIAHVRSASRKTGIRVGILQDLQGPKIRVGTIDPTTLSQGEKITVISGSKAVNGAIPITLKTLLKDVKKGDRILLNDGFIELHVIGKKGKELHAKVIQGGLLTSNKGVNFPDSHVSESAFTEKDHEDLIFGIEQGVDYIALSFIERPEEIAHIRDIVLRTAKRFHTLPPKIIVKIERPEALENFLEILPLVDGVMVARGDLGIEIPFEEVPLVQKELVEMCRMAGKPVIVATHMLESMTKNIRPTRAEVSDVANAVIDHTDAVMLSAETASGEHPYTVIQTMDRVVCETEASYLDDMIPDTYTEDTRTTFAQTVKRLAESGSISGIVVHAENDILLRRICSRRPSAPLFICCHSEDEARRMMLGAGIVPIVLPDARVGSFELLVYRTLLRQKYITKNDHIALVQEGTDGKLHLSVK